jgi:hypothetical protein
MPCCYHGRKISCIWIEKRIKEFSLPALSRWSIHRNNGLEDIIKRQMRQRHGRLGVSLEHFDLPLKLLDQN